MNDSSVQSDVVGSERLRLGNKLKKSSMPVARGSDPRQQKSPSNFYIYLTVSYGSIHTCTHVAVVLQDHQQCSIAGNLTGACMQLLHVAPFCHKPTSQVIY